MILIAQGEVAFSVRAEAIIHLQSSHTETVLFDKNVLIFSPIHPFSNFNSLYTITLLP